MRGLCVVLSLLCFGCVGWMGYYCGTMSSMARLGGEEQHELCHDTVSHEAYIVKRQGMYRCFMEHRDYPHRVRASHIDIEGVNE